MLAKKRMIDCTTVASSDFDDLSFMAQALYCRLVADTDDMGVAEAGGVIRYASRMRNSALQELIDLRKKSLSAKKSYYDYNRTL
mgnify:CR=1 FL=1